MEVLTIVDEDGFGMKQQALHLCWSKDLVMAVVFLATSTSSVKKAFQIMAPFLLEVNEL